MQTKSVLLLVSAAMLAFTAGALPLRGQSAAAAPPGGRFYRAATETTVKGSVVSVEQATGRRGWAGTHATLDTGTETLDVHIGPSWFLTQHNFAMNPGDQLEVTGSKVQINGKETLLAREITRNGTTLTLRNKQGFPVWSRRGGD